jgi:hypothetical protein
MRGINANSCIREIYYFRRLRQGLLFCLIAALLGGLIGQPIEIAAKETLAVIERDTLQTRYLVPVINHDAMIINLTDDPMTISIHSAIPQGKFVKNSPLSSFGRNSLLGVPMFAPFTYPIKNSIILGNPEIKMIGMQISYYWDHVVLPSDHAVRAQYDNYYAPVSLFYRNYGMNIASLLIRSNYRVTVEKGEKEEKLYHLGLNIHLENEGDQDVVDMFFRLFVPVALALEDRGDLHSLVEPMEIWFSDNLNVTISSITDGFGNAARGVEASVQIGTLKAGDTFHCALQIDCIKKAKKGEIYPVMTLLGRRQLVRVWPATIVKGAPMETQKKFHYLLYNLVIGARRIFHIHKKGITVIRAENEKVARQKIYSNSLRIFHQGHPEDTVSIDGLFIADGRAGQ